MPVGTHPAQTHRYTCINRSPTPTHNTAYQIISLCCRCAEIDQKPDPCILHGSECFHFTCNLQTTSRVESLIQSCRPCLLYRHPTWNDQKQPTIHNPSTAEWSRTQSVLFKFFLDNYIIGKICCYACHRSLPNHSPAHLCLSGSSCHPCQT